MSIQSEITRIANARNVIRTKLTNFGIATLTDTLDILATKLNAVVDRGTPDASVQEGETYTLERGYYHGGTVKGVAGGGHYTLQSKSGILPTKEKQTITADQGYYGLSSVEVSAIPDQYQDVSSVTATAADVLANKTIVTATGQTVAGTMPELGAVQKTLDATTGNQQYSIPAGHHNGNGKVLVVLEEKSVTPSGSSQNITPTAGKVLSKVVVDAIPEIYGDATNADAIQSNILSGKKAIVNVEDVATLITGNMPENGTVTKTLDATTNNQQYDIAEGHHSGNGKVSIVLEEKSATPSTSVQNITPTNGKVLSKVTVAAIPANYGDATNADADQDDILVGKKAVVLVDDEATLITGTMANIGEIEGEIDGLTSMSYTISAGKTSGGSVVLTDDIENALAAI